MFELLIGLIIFVVVLGLVFWLVGMLPIDGNLKNIINVALILVAVIYLLGILFGGAPMPHLIVPR